MNESLPAIQANKCESPLQMYSNRKEDLQEQMQEKKEEEDKQNKNKESCLAYE